MLIVEAMNLFVGTADPTASKHLSIQEVKLPLLQNKYQDHAAGGAILDIEVRTGIQKLEPTFKLVGHDPQVLTNFGYMSGEMTMYTMRGAMRDKITGKDVALKAVIEGELGKIESDAFQNGNLLTNDYAINGVLLYQLFFDDTEKYFFDWKNSVLRVDGVNRHAKRNAMLGLI